MLTMKNSVKNFTKNLLSRKHAPRVLVSPAVPMLMSRGLDLTGRRGERSFKRLYIVCVHSFTNPFLG